MAFVNEQISEIDQERINYSTLKDPQGGRFLAGRRIPRWTVDRERDAFLIKLGGGVAREDYIVPFYFLFSLQGVQIRVDAYQHETRSDNQLSLIWEIIKLQLTDVFPILNEDVTKILTEALNTYGSCSYDDSRAMFGEVHVNFSLMKGE